MRKLCILTAIISLLVTLSALGNDVKGTGINIANAPIGFSGVGLGTINGRTDAIVATFRNFSAKNVTAVQIGWVVMLGCSTAKTLPVSVGQVTKINIAPNQLSGGDNYVNAGAWEDDIVALMRQAKVTHALVVAAVVGVDFADGTSWRYDLTADPQHTFFGTDTYAGWQQVSCNKEMWSAIQKNNNKNNMPDVVSSSLDSVNQDLDTVSGART